MDKRFDFDERKKQALTAKLLSMGVQQPVFNSTSDQTDGFTICLDSIQGNKIEILSYTQIGNSYSGTMKVTYYDHFGLDAGDFTPSGYGSFKALAVNILTGFRQWHILQRWKELEATNHPKPFITTIEVVTTFSGVV